MRTSHVLVAALATCLAAGSASAASVVSPLFGSRVTEAPHFKIPYAIGDFDGDGVPDQVYLVSIAAGSATGGIAPDVKIDTTAFGSGGALGAHAAKLALAIVLGKSKKKFLFIDYESAAVTGYFDDTGMWPPQLPTPPITLAKRGSEDFKTFVAVEKKIKHDILVVNSESSVRTALYWNGTAFAMSDGDSEP
jgi:hypothetical protein